MNIAIIAFSRDQVSLVSLRTGSGKSIKMFDKYGAGFYNVSSLLTYGATISIITVYDVRLYN